MSENTGFPRVKKEKMRLNHERSIFENHRKCSPSDL